MLCDQLRIYQKRMDKTVEEMAALLRMKYNTYTKWVRTDAEMSLPPYDRVVAAADRLLVSVDWLVGRELATMWDTSLLAPMRAAIRHYVSESLSNGKSETRVCNLVRWTHEFDPERYDLPILSGVAFVKDEVMEEILAGADLKLSLPDRMAEFWHLSTKWLLGANCSPFATNLEPYMPVINTIEAIGLTPEYLMENRDILKESFEAWKSAQNAIRT